MSVYCVLTHTQLYHVDKGEIELVCVAWLPRDNGMRYVCILCARTIYRVNKEEYNSFFICVAWMPRDAVT